MSAISPLRFRIEGDNSNALRSMSDVQRASSKLGGDLQKNIGDKLSSVFSVAAIEEMVRRTGEWALELQQTAHGLGMTGEALQSLRVMAERAGVPTEKLFSFYSKLEAAASKAANGNAKLRQSFTALGVDINKLKGEGRYTSAQLFSQTLAGSKNEKGGSAIQEIYGTKNAFQIKMLASESKGQTPEQYQEAHKSQITPEKDTIGMSRAMIQIKEDLYSIVVTITPAIHLILAVVDGFAKMVSGFAGEVGDIIKGAWLGIKAARPKWLGGSDKADKEFADWGRTREARNRASVSGMTMGLWNPSNGKESGYGDRVLSEEERRQAVGGGEALTTLATMGYGPLAKGAGIGLGLAEKAAGAVGAETLAGTAGRMAAKTAGEGGWLKQGLIGKGGRAISKWSDKMLGRNLIGIQKQVPNSYIQNGQLMSSITGKPFTAGEMEIFSKNLVEGNLISKVGRATTSIGYMAMMMAGHAADIGYADTASSELFAGGVGEPPTRRGPLTLGGGGGAGGGAGSGNLAIGGVFGVDIQSKILTLNSQMVDLLQQIVENTTPDMSGGGEGEGGGSGG